MDSVRDDTKDKGLPGEEAYHSATWRRISVYISTKSGTRMNGKENVQNNEIFTPVPTSRGQTGHAAATHTPETSHQNIRSGWYFSD